MRKVLFINCSSRGSTGDIISSITDKLTSEGWKSVLCVNDVRNAEKSLSKIYKITRSQEARVNSLVSRFTGMPYGFAPLSTTKTKKIIIKEKPDIIHLHCPNGHILNLYSLIKWIKKKKIPTVITNHCEMFYTANCAHSYECEKWKNGCGYCEKLKDYVGKYYIDKTHKSWKKMHDSFTGFEKLAITSVSKWVYNRSKVSPILGRFPNYCVENGIDTNTFTYVPDKDNSIVDRYKIDANKKIVIFVTAHFTKSKGREYFLELAKQCADVAEFLLIGSIGAETGLPENVVNIGRVDSKEDLAKLYSLADASIILSKKETFSMTTAESLCCGTPVVGFKAGGPESIALLEYSQFCEYGDIQTLKKILEEALEIKLTEQNKKEISDIAKQKYEKERMANSYFEIYQGILQ